MFNDAYLSEDGTRHLILFSSELTPFLFNKNIDKQMTTMTDDDNDDDDDDDCNNNDNNINIYIHIHIYKDK